MTYKSNIDEFALKYAEENLGETPEIRDNTICELKNWLETLTFKARSDSVWILSFLRGCKFNISKTKSKIQTYLELRSTTPEWFSNRNPFLPELQELLDLGVFLPLRERDANGRLVIIIRAGAHDPKKHTQNNIFKISKMLLDIALEENEDVSVYGAVTIVDMRNICLGHTLQLTPAIIKKAVTAWQNYYVSPKSMNFIYAPLYVNVILDIFKQFMSKKLKERVHIHYSWSTDMGKIVDRNILPKEYGGEKYSFDELKLYWKDKCESYQQWFAEDEKRFGIKEI